MADDGEVSVDVVADTTAFETKLKAKLEALAKKLQAKIKLVLDDVAARASLKAFQATANKAKASLNATLSTKIATLDLNAFVRKASLKTIEISVKISKKSLAAAGGQLQSLSGINAISNTISKFSGEFTSFFDHLPSVGTAVLKFGSIASLAGTLIGSLFVTLNLLASAGPGLVASLVAIPGILAGVAVQAAVLVVALKNAPPAVKQAIAAYKGLQQIISNNFWTDAAKPAASFFTSIKQQVLDGFKVVSSASGSFFGSFLTSLQGTLGSGVLTQIFGNIQKSIAAFGPAADPLAVLIANLSLFGTSLLPAISGWLAKITQQFSTFVANGIASGSFIAGFQQLGVVIGIVWDGFKGLLSIIGGIGNAAANAGIGDLLSPLQQIGDIVNSPTFQVALTNLFQGAALGAKGLFTALGPIGQFLTNISPIIESFLTNAGATIGTLFTSLANALNRPEFRTGLSDFFNGILKFVQPLIPLMPIFAEKLGLIGTFAGNLLSVIGPVFASLLSLIVPVLSKIFVALTPLIDTLGPILSKVIAALAPVFGSLITALSPFLDLIVQLLPPALQLVQVIAAALAPALTRLAPAFTSLIAAAMPIITDLLGILMPLIGPLVQLLVMLLQVAVGPLTQAFQLFGPVLSAIAPILTVLADVIGAVVGTIVALFTGNFASIGPLWEGVWNAIMGVWENQTKPFFMGLASFFSGLWIGIVNFFSDKWTELTTLLSAAGKSLMKNWTDLWNGVQAVFVAVWNAISGFEKGIFNGIMKGIQGFVNGAIDTINGLTAGISSITAVVGIKLGKIPHVSLPQLALGATVLPRRGGTAAILGEGGRAESVVDTGKFNALMDIVLNAFPKALAAVSNRGAGNGSNPVGGPGSSRTYNTTNNFPVPDGTDPAEVAQEFVNRAAEKGVGFLGA